MIHLKIISNYFELYLKIDDVSTVGQPAAFHMLVMIDLTAVEEFQTNPKSFFEKYQNESSCM